MNGSLIIIYPFTKSDERMESELNQESKERHMESDYRDRGSKLSEGGLDWKTFPTMSLLS